MDQVLIREEWMKYRRFGKLDWEVSILGFGMRRLPLIDGDPTHIHEAESIKMIRYAIEHGINYLDLGFPYPINQYKSLAHLMNQVLEEGYREKVKIAVTLPLHFLNSPQDFILFLNEQLQILQVERIDFCLLGRLNRDNWPKLQELNLLHLAEKAMIEGQIGQLGFSFHDHYQILKNIVEAYDNWALCQFQYSYMDVDHDPGISGIKYAAERGLGVVISEPLRGGRLIKELPEPVAKLWAGSQKKWSLVEWGLRWAWNHPEISVVLSDMSTMRQVIENITIAESAEPDSLTIQELVLISKVRDAYRKLRPIACPSCRACMPCPQHIDVPRIFEIFNDAFIYNDIKMAQSIYIDEQHQLDHCTECGICEKACAKKLPIIDWLKKIKQMLGERRNST